MNDEGSHIRKQLILLLEGRTVHFAPWSSDWEQTKKKKKSNSSSIGESVNECRMSPYKETAHIIRLVQKQ